jgi:hypothetical protein|tara:strand:+ start:126 stop:329 length:204 start_codon:yes stop_codon:yes gene_type:complete
VYIGEDKDLAIKNVSDVTADGALLGLYILGIEYLCILRFDSVTAPGLKTPKEVCLSLGIKFADTPIS